MFPTVENNITGTIVAKNTTSVAGDGAADIDIRLDLTDGTALVLASFPQGTPIIITGSAYAAGDSMPEGIMQGVSEDSWTLQNIWTSFRIDGDALTNAIWIEKTSRGKTVGGYRALGMQLLDFRHAASIDDALWDGPGQNNPLLASTAVGNQNVTYKTEGVIPYTRRVGNELSYPVGLLNPMFLDQIDSIAAQNYGPKYFMMACSSAFKREVTWAWADYFKHTNVNFITAEAEQAVFKEMDETGKRVKIDFSWIEVNNRAFGFNTFFRFDDPNYVGADGYYGKNFAFMCPIGSKPDPKTPGNRINYFGVNYKAKDNYNRMDEVNARFGATNGTHTLSEDSNILSYKSHCGAEHCGGINMAVIEGN